MALETFDFVIETAFEPGVLAFTLLGAGQGGRSFGSPHASGALIPYTAFDTIGRREVGIGTFTAPNILARTLILASTNSNLIVNFDSGTVSVYEDLPAVASERLFRPTPPGGRLTLTSATPVLIATVSGAATVYYAPYTHNVLPIYNGVFWEVKAFTELSNVLANSTTGKAGPAAVTTNSNYDLFVWNDAGTLRLTRGPLWTSAVARGTGAGTSELVHVDGVWLNAVAITNGPAAQRGTYVGTVRTNGTSTVDWILGTSAAGGGASYLYLWNAYNRILLSTTVIDSTTDYTYNSATIRAANASNNNRVSFICGLALDSMEAFYSMLAISAASVSSFPAIGVAMDSTTVHDKRDIIFPATAVATGKTLQVRRTYAGQIGFHFIQASEAEFGALTSRFNVNVTYNGLDFKFFA